ncbi:hypothetical protein [Conexibacter sp. CPCC 206217]|uniref:hypothetical protein n=1 Tax=Conexibacter sp. CPCC 206217 TaxID=3064574 RepID=UPI0027247A71|nr:hypothetical protein [Conexibacter sp. CPCC 206217]MDO8213348.1 hypothetical protein [Conexibacter sp. CPCC 206217]
MGEMRLRGLLIGGSLFGVVLAVALALALRGVTADSAAADGDPLARSAPPVRALSATPTVATQRPDTRTRQGERIVSRPRTAVRKPDPDGGPDWAIRTYGSRSTWRERDGRLLVRPRNDCFQLGRVFEGRFGWIDGANVFRSVKPGAAGAPQLCTMLKFAGTLMSPSERVTRITEVGGGEPRPLQTVEWGVPTRSHGLPSLRIGSLAQEHAVRAEYRVADPGGGLPWGIDRADGPGSGCLIDFAPLVGERPGTLDRTLDTVTLPSFGATCPNHDDASRLTPRNPLVAWGGGAFRETDAERTARDRVALRTLPGRTTVVGRAHRDVVSVTVVSPRDVRTLTPSAHDRVFAAVWDGTFPTGRIELRARMRDGGTHVLRLRVWNP